jgi:hypothetical protein
MGYDELATATEHVVDGVPFIGPAQEIVNLITGKGDAEHQEIKEGIEDLAGSDHRDDEPARPLSEIPADPTDLPWYMKPAQWINNAID